MKIKKLNTKREISRIKNLLNKNFDQVNIYVSWNRKRKHNKIIIKDVPLLKEKGILHLIGIVYSTVSKEEKSFMGQTMLLTDQNNKEISYTTLFTKERCIEISYDWETGLRLMAMTLNEY